MKSTHTLLAVLASLALGSAAFAGTPEDAAAEQPVVAKVVNPSIPQDFTRSVVKVRFSLDEAGQPKNVRVISPTDDEVKKYVIKAFKEWRFEVASLDTTAGAKRYVLPLDIIPEV